MQKSTQTGFTLIELVVVIVILGILAATALPKFIDLSDEANQAAVEGVAGAITSASAVNYGVRKATTAKGVVVDNCDDAGSLLQSGVLPSGYTVANVAILVDEAKNCTVTKGTKTATATLIGVN